jgi:VanZ family protein
VGSTLAIVAGCVFPGRSIPKLAFAGADKAVHFGMFMLWAIAWLAALGPGYLRMVAVFFGGVILASATEMAQGLLPWQRSPDYLDWAADLAGVVLACGVWWLAGLSREKSRSP